MNAGGRLRALVSSAGGDSSSSGSGCCRRGSRRGLSRSQRSQSRRDARGPSVELFMQLLHGLSKMELDVPRQMEITVACGAVVRAVNTVFARACVAVDDRIGFLANVARGHAHHPPTGRAVRVR
jgi:hypothetical protein